MRKPNLYVPSSLACQILHIKTMLAVVELDIYGNVFCVMDLKV